MHNKTLFITIVKPKKASNSQTCGSWTENFLLEKLTNSANKNLTTSDYTSNQL